MIVPWLIFIALGLVTYAGFLKLAARLLRYSVSWTSSFLFASIMLIAVIIDHVLVFSQPLAIRIANGVVLLLGLVVLGGWFFSRRGSNRSGAVLGWSSGLWLMALTFAMMITVTFAIVIPVRSFSAITFPRRHNPVDKKQPTHCITSWTRSTLLI